MWSLAHTLIESLIALGLIAYLLARWHQYGRMIDLRYAQATVPWLVMIGMGYLLTLGWFQGYERTATRVAYQFLIFGVSVFLMSAVAGFPGHRLAALVALSQLVMGLGCASLAHQWAGAWEGVNLCGTVILVLMLAHTIWGKSSARGWMVLLMSVLGVGVMLVDMRAAGDGPVRVSAAHDAYAIGLFVLWRALTHRLSVVKQLPAPGPVRDQLAQDLHDGVGAQLASIILALDVGQPTQRATAVSLQHCLVELKLLVDGADSEASALSHLACLRYRMQPLLEMASVELYWDISETERLDAVRGDSARQVLRIAQEALANAMRHSGATQIRVTCRYAKTYDELVLEVADNGIGIPAHLLMQSVEMATPAADRSLLCMGKGLSGMRRRARHLGGYVMVDSAPGQGACVRLVMPMARVIGKAPAIPAVNV